MIVNNTITTLKTSYSDMTYEIGLSNNIKEKLFQEFTDKYTAIPTFEHKCNNCGGILEMKIDEHIFKCPYCGSCYAIGTMQIHAI